MSFEIIEGIVVITCEDCNSEIPLKVCQSAAGYYVGRFCPECGPYSRDSDYFKTREQAQSYLDEWIRSEVE